MIYKICVWLLIAAFLAVVSGCGNSSRVSETVGQTKSLTVGTVQKEIQKGMTQSEVAVALGSPNIVTSSTKNEETWIYDKMSSAVDYKKSSAYGTLILVGHSSSNKKTNTSQKTLTVIIKFIEGKVNETKYHSSSF